MTDNEKLIAFMKRVTPIIHEPLAQQVAEEWATKFVQEFPEFVQAGCQHDWQNRVSGGSKCRNCNVWQDKRVAEKARIPTDDERTRIEQSNTVATIVFDQVKRVWPDLHPLLDLRYGIADALWAAGFRRSVVPEPSAALDAIERAKAFLTDASETSEMRNRNAYGALKVIRAEPQGEPSDAHESHDFCDLRLGCIITEPTDEQARAVVREVYGPGEPEAWQMDNARAALRAASSATEQGEDR